MIDSFRGPYRFLSNFYPCEVRCRDGMYPSVEHAYQAAKTLDPVARERVRGAETAGKAKRMGRGLVLRPGWDTLRLTVMERLLWAKFSDPVLMRLLRDTGDAQLVEGNTWGDRFWGVCAGAGENHLGRLLMVVRAPTRVVNLREERYDVYIGRRGHGHDGYFGNPFKLPPGEPRGATLAIWREHFHKRIATDEVFRSRVIRELRGKRLGCFCAPLACHGDTYVEFFESRYASQDR